MNKIIITGNVGKDPEIRSVSTGEIVEFSVAVNTGKDKAEWVKCSVFNEKLREIVKNYVKKGSKLLVEGMPKANAYVNKEGKAVAELQVTVNTVELLNKVENSTAHNKSDTHDLQSDDVPF